MIGTSRSRWIFALLFIALAGCKNAATDDSGATQASAADANEGSDVAFYRSVLEKVHDNYVSPVQEETLLDNSLKGMLNGLDPHSDYMTEHEYQDMLDDSAGEFAGIGAELTRDDSHPIVLSPIDDTPASRAGIHAGDIILRINGRATDGMSLKDVVDSLRGPADSKVAITIGRKDAPPFDVTLTRAIIHVNSVDKEAMEPNGVGYIRISSFAETTQTDLLKALDELKTKNKGPLKGLVLDLRNNPGGLLDQAVRVSGDFLDGGTTVSIRGRSSDDNHVFPAPPNGDRLPGVPVVVLINGASASAAEIVAGALQDRHRAEILGTQSFGKGSVQTIIPLDGRGALRLTTDRYYTPSGRSIQGQGITPDRVVEQPKGPDATEVDLVRESELQGALTNGSKPKDADDDTPAPVHNEVMINAAAVGTAKDSQLKAALDDINKRFQVGSQQ